MISVLLEELCPLLAEVACRNGWTIAKEDRSSSFGNALVELEGSDFYTQVVRDRGDVSINLAPIGKRKKWTNLETILTFIGEDVPSRAPEALLKLLVKNIGKIGVLMSSNASQLDEFEKGVRRRSSRESFHPSERLTF